MKQENSTKLALLKALDKSETKSVVEACRLANVTRGTFYFHYYKDAQFRESVLGKRQEYLAGKAATI